MKKDLIVCSGWIPSYQVSKKYRTLKQKHPNQNIVFYYDGIPFDQHNEDEFNYMFDEALAFYFIEVRKILKRDMNVRTAWAKFKMQEEHIDDLMSLNSEMMVQYIQTCSNLQDVLYQLKIHVYSLLAKGLNVPYYEYYLSIIKQRFPLEEIANQRKQQQAKRQKKVANKL